MTIRIGLAGLDSSHSEDFLRHFNSEARHPEMRITALWGSDAARIAQLTQIDPALTPAPSLDALIAGVDAVIVGDRDGRLHRAHALPCLAAGRPVFIDKPLANGLDDATAIVATADSRGAPLLSGSALRWQAESRRLKAKLSGVDAPLNITAHGTWYPQSEYGGAIFYAIHTVELVQELIGCTWENPVRVPDLPAAVAYQSGPHRVTLEFRPLGPSGSSVFGVTVDAAGIHIDQAVPLGDDYMAPVAVQIAAMLLSGRNSITGDEMLAPVALMERIDALLGKAT